MRFFDAEWNPCPGVCRDIRVTRGRSWFYVWDGGVEEAAVPRTEALDRAFEGAEVRPFAAATAEPEYVRNFGSRSRPRRSRDAIPALYRLKGRLESGRGPIPANLPKYGGPEPHAVPERLSWDPFEVLVGTRRSSLAVVPRAKSVGAAPGRPLPAYCQAWLGLSGPVTVAESAELAGMGGETVRKQLSRWVRRGMLSPPEYWDGNAVYSGEELARLATWQVGQAQ